MNFNHVCCMLCFAWMTHGCTMHTGQTHSGALHTPSLVPDGRLDFAWKLSGDRAVAPLQVFSDNRYTWLQWHPNQTVPAILAHHEGQEQVLHYTRQAPYTILEGQWTRLSFRAGRQQAYARRVQPQIDAATIAPVQEPVMQEPAKQQPAKHVQVIQAGSTPTPSVTAPTRTFVVTPEDQHLRQALVRWSGISGWHFQPEHWGVDVDIPLSAGASFSDDFVDSVQALLLSTELSDRPLQPCFYSNQVLRVVPYAESCDRTNVPGAPV